MKDQDNTKLYANQGFAGMSIDISQRMQIDHALQKCEEKFKGIFNNARDGILLADIETKKFILGNAMICQMLGYGMDELMTMGVEDIHAAENLPEVLDRFEKLARQETALVADIPVKRKDGSLFFADINSFFMELNGNTYLVGFFRDITERKRAEEALREAQRDLNRAQAVSRTGSWRLDLRRNDLVWSDETYRMFGIAQYTPLTYEAFLSVVHPEDREFVDREWTAALGGKAYDIEHRIVVGDTVRWVREKAELDFDPQGALLRGFGMVQDITERKRAESIMQARLRLLKFAESHSLDEFTQAALDESEALTGSTIGFYHLVKADQQTLALQSWSTNTLQNMCKAEGKGRHYDIAEAGVWVDCVHQRRPVIHNNYEAITHRRGMPPGHAPVVRELVVPILREDKIVAIIGVGNKPSDYDEQDVEVVSLLGDLSWDITERKRGEAELSHRTAELEASNQELESFSYSVAHDLKTPIRAIEGFSRMLMGEHADQLDAEALRLLQVICTNTKIMAQLIDDLLGLSRLTRQPLRKTELHLDDMARQIFELLKSQAPDRNLQLTVNELPTAYADHSLLYQVMLNLLGNAIKYTKTRETAIIDAGGHTEGNENIYYIKDNGIGFDQRYIDNLFGPFQRLHSLDEYEGTGIGLAIVQRIIQKHGGRVWGESKVGAGATFYFALPKNGR